jgi:hypothetical protein
MQKISGVIILLLGVAVVVGARRIADHYGAEVQPPFSGAPTDRAVYIYVCGGVIALLGVVQFFWKRK